MKAAFAILAVILMIASPMFLQPSEAQDVNYVTPPAADEIFTITMTNLKSDDPTQTVVYDADSGSAQFFMAYTVYRAEKGHSGFSCTETHCLPSWIQWSVSARADNPEAAKLTVSISPALQQVAEDTHGDYWIHFRCEYPNIFSTEECSFLIKIHLDVQWNGSVIVQDDVYHTYALTFDSLGGSVSQTYYWQVLANLDTGIHYFDTTTVAPSKEGFSFKGWSTVNGDNQPSDVSDDFPLIAANADSVNSSDPNNIVYSKTVYAIWEKESFQDLPDTLRDLVSLLSNPAVLAILFALVIGTAYVVRVRRLGMWGMRRWHGFCRYSRRSERPSGVCSPSWTCRMPSPWRTP